MHLSKTKINAVGGPSGGKHEAWVK